MSSMLEEDEREKEMKCSDDLTHCKLI